MIFGIREIPPRAYCGREKLKKVLIGEGVEYIGQKAFADCKRLEEVVFPKSLKTVREGAFQGCPVEALTIPENAVCIERFSFRDTKRLKRVDFLGKAALNNQVFAGSKIRSIYLHRGMVLKPFLMQTVTLFCPPEDKAMIAFFKSIGYSEETVEGWTALRVVHHRQIDRAPVPDVLMEESAVHIGKRIENFQYANQEQLRRIIISEGTEKIGEGAFFNCDALEEIVLPKSLRYLGHSCFANCRRLEKISLPEGITVLPARAFRDCRRLKKVQLPESIRIIDQGCFQNCERLERINWPAELLRINEYAFYGCQGLASFSLPLDVSIVEKNAFTNCKKIKYVKTGANVAYFSPKSFAARTILECPENSLTLKMAREAGLKTIVSTLYEKMKEA